MEEITATFLREFRRFDETTAVLNVRREHNPLNIVCKCAEHDLISGQDYIFAGEYREHPRYGRQFSAASFAVALPVSREATILFLQKFSKIGKKTAAEIYDRYGSDTLDVIASEPRSLLGFRGISEFFSAQISEAVRGDIANSKNKIELASYLAGSGFPRGIVEILYGKYGVSALDKLRANPYLLLREDGCGFTGVDAFALKNGYNPRRLKRQALFLLHTMGESEDVWFPEHWVKSELAKRFGLELQYVKTLQLLRRAGKLVGRKAEGLWWMAPAHDAENEKRIAEEIHAHCEPNFPVSFADTELSESQAEALKIATSQKIGCFVGGPGTGKTYSVARYIRGIVERYGTDAILVVAPTGKAVVRSREMLASIGVECECRTIHSWLMNPIPTQFIICDESSMIDAGLMARFLPCAQGSSLLFVGDDGQLLPVGKGRPFADMIASGVVPTGKLTQTMRNSGRIVRVCHAIRQNIPWETPETLWLEQGENMRLVPSGNFLETVKRLVDTHRPDTDIIREIQVIVGVNRGACGREEMNRELQGFMNPGHPTNRKYRVGDPVICLRNGKYRDAETREEKVYLSNGEIGYCTSTDDRGDVVVDFGTEKIVRLQQTHFQFDLAYAVTCHKMQGSETPIAIVILDPSYTARRVCTREWLYTAISRAKRICYLVGERATADAFCRTLGNVRKTFLTNEILQEKNNGRKFNM